ncbi:hypothetical protein ACFC1D_01790 [Streptomyces vinaceus]
MTYALTSPEGEPHRDLDRGHATAHGLIGADDPMLRVGLFLLHAETEN